MCRSIKNLFNFDPPATEEEAKAAAIQFVRKVSGFKIPSQTNEAAFNKAIEEITQSTQKLLSSLSTNAQPKNREIEAKKAKERSLKRFS